MFFIILCLRRTERSFSTTVTNNNLLIFKTILPGNQKEKNNLPVFWIRWKPGRRTVRISTGCWLPRKFWMGFMILPQRTERLFFPLDLLIQRFFEPGDCFFFLIYWNNASSNREHSFHPRYYTIHIGSEKHKRFFLKNSNHIDPYSFAQKEYDPQRSVIRLASEKCESFSLKNERTGNFRSVLFSAKKTVNCLCVNSGKI